MIKRLYFLVFILSSNLVVAANTSEHFIIHGVKGKVLRNIQTRFQELSENNPLQNQSDEVLIQQATLAMEPYAYFKPLIHIIRLENGKLTKIKITPGPLLRVTQMTVKLEGPGAKDKTIQKIGQNLALKPGKAANSLKYAKSKQTLIDAATHQGYLKARFEKAEILIDKAAYTAKITLILNTGPQYYFGQVQFDPTYISEELLRRYIPFHYGQAYSTEQLLAFNNQLALSGYFSQISVKPKFLEGEAIPVKVALKPRHRINYSLGLGYGTDTGIRGRVGYHVIPVNRAGHKFNAIALGSFNQNSLQAQYQIPGKNPLTDEYDITANLSNLSYNTGNSNAFLAAFAQQHNREHFQRIVSLNGLYERFNYTDAPKEATFTLFPKVSFSWKKISNPLFSPTGYRLTLNGLAAHQALLSQISFAQASLDARAAFTLDALRTRFYAHTIQGITQINDINQLPLSLALLLGGTDNLKAYSFNTIGPGKILNYAGFEIQKEFMKKWYLTGFFDSGTVYNPVEKIMENDAGLGLMWVSPVGPIKIGVAYALDNDFNFIPGGHPKFVLNMGPDL